MVSVAGSISSAVTRAWNVLAERVVQSPSQPRRLAGLEALHVGHVELDRLGRYLAVTALVGACLLTSAWSRIDLRRTSMQLDRADAAFESARAEHARLRLELATLQDPSNLHHAAAELALQPTTAIVDVPAAP